mgnify:FL=1
MNESLKAALERFGRVFLSTFISLFIVQMAQADTQIIIKIGLASGILEFFKSLFFFFFIPAIISSMAGAISGTFKYFRDEGIVPPKTLL